MVQQFWQIVLILVVVEYALGAFGNSPVTLWADLS